MSVDNTTSVRPESDNDRELRSVDRYEWEQIVRRARFDGVIGASSKLGKNGRPTRGGVAGLTVTAIAMCFASYGDGGGRNIWPGDATVAIDLETTIDRVRTVRQKLLSLGMLRPVGRPRMDRGTQYQLTLPTDLLDRLDVLTPAQHKLAAHNLREKARGKSKTQDAGSSVGVPGPDTAGTPQDHPAGSLDEVSGTPQDHPNHQPDEQPGWSDGPPEMASGWSDGGRSGGPTETHTIHDQSIRTTNHPEHDLRTAVTVAREPDAADEILSDFEDGQGDPDRCPDGLPTTRRPDGRPDCVACRVREDRAAGRRPTPLPHRANDADRVATGDAVVLPFRATPGLRRRPRTAS